MDAPVYGVLTSHQRDTPCTATRPPPDRGRPPCSVLFLNSDRSRHPPAHTDWVRDTDRGPCRGRSRQTILTAVPNPRSDRARSPKSGSEGSIRIRRPARCRSGKCAERSTESPKSKAQNHSSMRIPMVRSWIRFHRIYRSSTVVESTIKAYRANRENTLG